MEDIIYVQLVIETMQDTKFQLRRMGEVMCCVNGMFFLFTAVTVGPLINIDEIMNAVMYI